MGRNPWESAIEIALAVIATAVIIYALLSRPQTPTVQKPLARHVLLEGCWLKATAIPWSGDMEDWICAV